jgi:hypothetical protein
MGLGNFGICTDAVGVVVMSTLRADSLLSNIIAPISREKWFLDRLKVCKLPNEYAAELQDIIENISRSAAADSVLSTVDNGNSGFSLWICDSLSRVGYQKLVAVDSTFQHLTLRCTTPASPTRVHEYSIVFPKPDAAVKPSLEVSLPMAVHFMWTWTEGGVQSSLLDIMTAVEREVAKFESFFQVNLLFIERLFIFALLLF